MRFRKRPIEVEAEQFLLWKQPFPAGVVEEVVSGDDRTIEGAVVKFYVITIHGQKAYLNNQDWVITEPDGIHHYPCKPDIFEATYEQVH